MTGALRVLVSAYACEPERGSEPGIGWNVVRQLARDFDVTVVTRTSNRRTIEAAEWPADLRPVRFLYHDLPPFLRSWKRGGRGVQAYYLLWQHSLGRFLRPVVKPDAFDVTMHITFGRYWVASALSDLYPPFVFGPVGGGDSVPEHFRSMLGRRGRLFNALRERVRWLAEHTPSVRRTARASTIALGTTPATAARLRAIGARDVAVEPAVGLPPDEVALFGDYPLAPPGPVRFVSAGSFVAWKGFDLGLRAFAAALADLDGATYHLIGEGPDRDRLEQLTRHLDLDDRVTFHGSLPRDETIRTIGEGHVLVHPSYHDSGGWVCLEAMALGRPVICLDLAGPSVLVPSGAGAKVAVTTPRETLEALADAMRIVGIDADARRRMGLVGREHVATSLNWDQRGEVLRSICRRAAGVLPS